MEVWIFVNVNKSKETKVKTPTVMLRDSHGTYWNEDMVKCGKITNLEKVHSKTQTTFVFIGYV